MSGVSILGGGLAAYSCERLLTRFGFDVQIEAAQSLKVPVVLLPDRAVHMIRDVLAQADLFANAPRITKRIVKWGMTVEPAVLDHAALLVTSLPEPTKVRAATARKRTIYTSPPVAQATEELHFGNRLAHVSEVRLREDSDRSACWIEDLNDGWLFLISNWLLSIGQPADDALGQSKLIAAQIDAVTKNGGQFPSHPRLLDPLCGPRWFACGTAAIGFDPICGDGTAHALREAILVSALIQAIDRGEDEAAVLNHYQRRMMEGMQKHLLLCRDHYGSAQGGPWWSAQIDALLAGYQWCSKRLAEMPPHVYTLQGFQLVRWHI